MSEMKYFVTRSYNEFVDNGMAKYTNIWKNMIRALTSVIFYNSAPKLIMDDLNVP